MSDSEYILEARDISKSFPGVKALDKVTLRVRPGTVHALMGENGAGKSTLMKCIYGIYSPDSGEIYVNGNKTTMANPRHAMDQGISMIHQELHPIRPQTVSENIFLGRIPYKKRLGIKWVDYKTLNEQTAKVFERLGLEIDPKQKVQELSTSYCQLLEIARAVSFGAKTIIMDEPTSSLTETETEILFRIIDQLKKDNVAIVYISHKIDEILKISDEITIMRDGKLVGCYPASEMTTDSIVNKMVGREMNDRFPPKKHVPGDTLLSVEHFTSTNPHSFKDVSFQVKRGEIFGIGGLVGSQRSELIEAIFGLHPVKSGDISIDGKPVKISKPFDSIKAGMALLTEDRRKTGILGALSIVDNIMVVQQNLKKKKYTGKAGFVNFKKRNEAAQSYVDKLEIKTPGLKTQIQSLSGGNQQKVLLGRWLLTEPQILILDEPTRGIDVGAKYEIYELMEEMAAEGKCVIMISSEMPELMGMSDRIMVMCEGHKSGELEKDEIDDERIMMLASTYKPEETGNEK
ncbi:MAG: sugar ABC transporter ATP-binding protein [Lachnospiraceae bacterium]|nr:sugar ABC transporter ATP-binding protein [Lachnospiraceae bacterium]